MHSLAIIADPHYHEVFPGYRFAGVEFDGRPGACIRTRADSAASTRIFNESYFAFPAALDACVAQGIRTVVIAGDLTDDGQIATMDAALAILARYEAAHGMRFFLTPGNHDVYGMSGRHHAKTFQAAGGTATVTSDPDAAKADRLIHEPAMFCRSYAETAPLWGPYGVQRRTEDLHWECPFGPDDDFTGRMFEMASPDGSVSHRQLDLSYLVEPEPGLWLVSVDANVFEPRNRCPDNTRPDAFKDSTDAGWDALVRLKPFILDWLADVAARARASGKTLICFSHYPMLDTYDGTMAQEAALFGATAAQRRTPSIGTGRALARTGIGTHFSGHLHVSDTSTLSDGPHRLTNIAVPSPVAFPPAIALVQADGDAIRVENRLLELDRFDAFFPFYRPGAEAAGQSPAWTEARSYPDFLYRHVRELVVHRYLPREWPSDLARVMQTLSVTDLFAIAAADDPLDPETISASGPGSDGPSAIDLVTDWYAARMASGLAVAFIAPARIETYLRLVEAYARRDWSDPACLQSRLKLLMQMMGRYLDIDQPVREAAQ